MVHNFIDMVGQKYGRLTVVERVNNPKSKQACWRCFCDCGNEKIVKGSYLRSGDSKSYGCLKKDMCIERNKTTHKNITVMKYVMIM